MKKRYWPWIIILLAGISIFALLDDRLQNTKASGFWKRGGAPEIRDTREQQKVSLDGSRPLPILRGLGLEAKLADLLQALRSKQLNNQALETILQNLKQECLEEDPGVATETLLKFLDTSQDAPTGLRFAAGEGGLRSAPTFRVFLLDALGAVDPSAADDYAQKAIFPGSNAAEEYAIALRNLWWNDPLGERAGELRGRIGFMMGRADWIQNPQAGFLEAFDAIPLSMTPEEALPRLSGLLENDDRLKNAAVLVLDRMAIKDSGSMVKALTSGDFKINGTVRAELLARADLRDPVQAAAVHGYLQGLEPGDEAGMFFASFPNHIYSVAPGLFEQPKIPDGIQMREMDLAARRVLEEWVALGDLKQHQMGLAQLLNRLNENARNVEASQ